MDVPDVLLPPHSCRRSDSRGRRLHYFIQTAHSLDQYALASCHTPPAPEHTQSIRAALEGTSSSSERRLAAATVITTGRLGDPITKLR